MTGALRPAADLSWRRVDDEIVILDLRTRAYYSLNEVGARIWELLADGRSPESAAGVVAKAIHGPDAHGRRLDECGGGEERGWEGLCPVDVLDPTIQGCAHRSGVLLIVEKGE